MGRGPVLPIMCLVQGSGCLFHWFIRPTGQKGKQFIVVREEPSLIKLLVDSSNRVFKGSFVFQSCFGFQSSPVVYAWRLALRHQNLVVTCLVVAWRG